MVPFQTKGQKFLPWTDRREIVMSSLFLEIFEDMESIWKMELSPKELSLLLGMILGKNMKKGGRKSPAARVDLCFIQISPGLKDPERKSQSLKK